jgi:hypothetical protein
MERAMEEIEELVAYGVVTGVAWGLLAVLLFLLPLAIPRLIVRCRRHFWCATAGARAEVEFEERGLPGFRTATAVLSCSCFDPPEAVACERRCLDPTFRSVGGSS